MISQNQLETEIAEMTKEALVANGVVVKKWLVQRVLNGWSPPGGSDAARWLLCGNGHIKATVQRVVSSYALAVKDGGGDETQLILPGLDHVRAAYLVARDGQQCLVRTDLITDDELLARATELEAMGAGCYAHAREIRRYIAERRQQSVPGTG